MLKRNRQIVILVLTVVLLLSISLVAQAQQTQIGVTWWGSQSRHDRTIQVIEMYEAENPDIDIVYEFSDWANYWTKVNTQVAGGELACIMQQDYAFVTEWANRGLLLALDPFFEDGTIDTSNISESLLEGGRVGDSIYAISLGTNSQTFILDVDAFEAAGIELPSEQWTWTEFEEIALALHEELGIWGFGGALHDNQLWKSLYMGLGTWAFNDEGTAIGYDDDQPLIEYFNMILRLQEAGAIPTREEAAEFQGGVEGDPIVAGDAAMSYMWSNQIVAVWTAAGEDRNFRLWELPRTTADVSQNYLKPSQFFSISAQCENPVEAAQFIDYFTNSLEANDVLFAERGVPISSAVREHLLPMLDTASAETFAYLAHVETDNSAIRPPDPAGWTDLLNNVYNPLFADPILYGQLSVEEGVALLREETNAILGQNE